VPCKISRLLHTTIHSLRKHNTLLQKISTNEDFEISNVLSRFTLDVLGKTVLGYNFNRLDDAASEEYKAYTVVMSHLFGVLFKVFPFLQKLHFLPVTAEFVSSNSRLANFFHRIVKIEKEKDPSEKSNNLVNTMIQLNSSNLITEKELVGNIWLLFIAGHETTATALSWGLYELALYPEIQEEISQEIISIFGRDRVPAMEDVDKSVKLNCFMNEVLRLHPPITLIPTRVATCDIQYKNYCIPKGTPIAINFMALHRHPAHWENPDKFDPKRFLPENSKSRHLFAYMPFSSGKRQCTGMHFSLTEQRLFYVLFLSKFRVGQPRDLEKRKEPHTPNHIGLNTPHNVTVRIVKRDY